MQMNEMLVTIDVTAQPKKWTSFGETSLAESEICEIFGFSALFLTAVYEL